MKTPNGNIYTVGKFHIDLYMDRKRKLQRCNHIRNCQECQDDIDDAVDAMLEGVLGPAEERGKSSTEGADTDDTEEDQTENTPGLEQYQDEDSLRASRTLTRGNSRRWTSPPDSQPGGRPSQ